jgi:hypothetical protein
VNLREIVVSKTTGLSTRVLELSSTLERWS